jgi:flagellar export protein FliJ
MKPFLFRLEPVLALRAAKLNEAERTYAHAWQVANHAEQQLAEATAELERLHEVLQSSRSGRFQKNDQIISLKAIEYQQSLCARQAERLARAQEEARARRQELLAAKRAHEVLRRLRGRLQQRHLHQEERREQNAVDETVMARFAAKLSNAAA